MAWTWPLMQHGSVSGVVLWKALAESGGVRACRGSSDCIGCGWMARAWLRMRLRSVSVVVVWSAGLVCRMGVRSASLVVVELCVFHSGGKSGGSGGMAWAWLLMLLGSASVVVLWRALAVTGKASACRSSSESCGSGRMAKLGGCRVFGPSGSE
jgi:hypothetical protein